MWSGADSDYELVVADGRAIEEWSAAAGERPTRRSSEREPADSLRDKSNATGGWPASLTFALDLLLVHP